MAKAYEDYGPFNITLRKFMSRLTNPQGPPFVYAGRMFVLESSTNEAAVMAAMDEFTSLTASDQMQAATIHVEEQTGADATNEVRTLCTSSLPYFPALERHLPQVLHLIIIP